MKNLKLGFFDSGVGGFTVLKSILTRHGDLSTIYLGDLQRVPYGKKSRSEIREIATEVLDWLKAQEISALIVACNTTNSLAIDLLNEQSTVPVFGLIESVYEAFGEFETRIGVLATPSTALSGAYKRNIQLFRPYMSVFEQGCPSLVPLIETGQLSSNDLRNAVEAYIQPLLDNDIQAIVLGCSHYPLIEPLIRELLPDRVRLIDPSKTLARKLDDHLGLPKFVNQKMPSFSNTQFYVTSDRDGFATRAQYWLGIRPEVKLISLQSKACIF